MLVVGGHVFDRAALMPPSAGRRSAASAIRSRSVVMTSFEVVVISPLQVRHAWSYPSPIAATRPEVHGGSQHDVVLVVAARDRTTASMRVGLDVVRPG
jgi:hypothetical protein